jgi:tight adherence protein C
MTMGDLHPAGAVASLLAALIVLWVSFGQLALDRRARARRLGMIGGNFEGPTPRRIFRKALTDKRKSLSLKIPRTAVLRAELRAAGFENANAVTTYQLQRVAWAATALAVATITKVTINPLEFGVVADIMMLAILLILTDKIHWAVIKLRARKRAQAIDREVADFLDLMVLGAEAGYSVEKSIRRILSFQDTVSPLYFELQLLTAELQLSADREQPFRSMADGVRSSALASFVQTSLQSEKYGAPLAAALRALRDELREQRLLEAEVRAGKLPALMTVPMVVLIMPALIVAVGGPMVLELLANYSETVD